MIQYILDNKEWIFSGIGIFVLTILVSIFLNKRKNEKSLISNEISSNVNLKESNSNTIQLINNQTNVKNESKVQSNQDVKNSLKEVYRLLDIAIKSIEIGLSPIKINPTKTNIEYYIEAKNKCIELIDYHDQNDFLFDTEINATIREIIGLLIDCLKQQDLIEFCHSMKFNNQLLVEEIKKMNIIYDTIVKKEIPLLKNKLSEQINRYFKN